MPKSSDLIGRPTSPVQEVIRRYAEDTVQRLNRQEVLDALSVQGIDNLDALVDKALEATRAGQHVGGGSQVARDTFLFTQFVYRTEGPGLPSEILEEVSAKVKRLR